MYGLKYQTKYNKFNKTAYSNYSFYQIWFNRYIVTYQDKKFKQQNKSKQGFI